MTMNMMEKQFAEIRKQLEEIDNEFQELTGKTVKQAESILCAVDYRNVQREKGKLKGEKEDYPFNNEALELLKKYNEITENLYFGNVD